MKKLYTSPDLLFVQHLKLLLESQGIETIVKNQELSSLQGGIPAQDTWPELWLIDSQTAPKAELNLKKFLNSQVSNETAWPCPKCNELIEAQFTHCWSCGAAKTP